MSGPFDFEGVRIEERIVPESPAALASALGERAERGFALLVRGGGSRLEIGNALVRADVLLETRGLARLRVLDADEGVLEAEAGVPLVALRSAAADAGWELPLDPPGAASTLGGALASAQPGPCFPHARDAVLGIEVALASGKLARSGGRVVKNVTGYDLPKLFTGSFGALGVVTSAWLRLRPLPEVREVLAAAPPADAALALACARRPSVRAALEIAAPLAAALVPGRAGPLLLLALAGDAPAVEADHAWIAERVGVDTAPAEALDAARALLGGEAAAGEPPPDLVVRVAVLPTAVARTAAALREAGAHVIAQPARGLVHARAPRPAHADPAAADALLEAARAATADGRGTLRIERAPLERKRGLDVFGEPGPHLALLRRLKQAFDPACALNPGRFAGRL